MWKINGIGGLSVGLREKTNINLLIFLQILQKLSNSIQYLILSQGIRLSRYFICCHWCDFSQVSAGIEYHKYLYPIYLKQLIVLIQMNVHCIRYMLQMNI